MRRDNASDIDDAIVVKPQARAVDGGAAGGSCVAYGTQVRDGDGEEGEDGGEEDDGVADVAQQLEARAACGSQRRGVVPAPESCIQYTKPVMVLGGGSCTSLRDPHTRSASAAPP